jgi:predicted nucleotidyltransferase
MLHIETIDNETLDLLKRIQSNPYFSQTRLVGGTALALQIGHRKSIDLNLFGKIEINPIELQQELQAYGTLSLRNDSARIHQFLLRGIQVDVVQYDYPWLQDPVCHGGITLASIPDIAAMKLAAVTNRGTKKDFVDIAFLLKRFDLPQMLAFYQTKFPDGSAFLVLKSLAFFDDAEDDPMPNMLISTTWESICQTVRTAVRNYQDHT